jgi:membrane protein DedA with SNARE-associated domain
MAGSMGVRPIVFYGLDGLAALISVPVWVFIGRWFGENLDYALKVAQRVQLSVFVGVALLIAGYFIFKRYKRNQRAVRMKRYRTLNQDVKSPT